jgi:hypothetical protein
LRICAEQRLAEIDAATARIIPSGRELEVRAAVGWWLAQSAAVWWRIVKDGRNVRASCASSTGRSGVAVRLVVHRSRIPELSLLIRCRGGRLVLAMIEKRLNI